MLVPEAEGGLLGRDLVVALGMTVEIKKGILKVGLCLLAPQDKVRAGHVPISCGGKSVCIAGPDVPREHLV